MLGWDNRFVVLRNPRGEWELPGGRLDPEDPDLPTALRRELREELAIDGRVDALVDTWIYRIATTGPAGAGRRVVIVTYGCTATEPNRLWHSEEHSEVAMLSFQELQVSPIPLGYLRSIARVAGLPWGFPTDTDLSRLADR